jgi:hypothetical protein
MLDVLFLPKFHILPTFYEKIDGKYVGRYIPIVLLISNYFHYFNIIFYVHILCLFKRNFELGILG